MTACSDDSVNLWSYRQKTPEIVHSLKFCRERYVGMSKDGGVVLRVWGSSIAGVGKE